MDAALRARTTPEELFLRWRDAGDTAAMAGLFDAEAPILFRTAINLCSDPSLAEEAVQETFLAAMEAPGNWDDARRVGPWLTGILRIKILELRRRNARRPDPARLPPPPAPDDPAVASAMAEDVERVRAAIRELPEPYRSVALLRWVHGLEPAAIADLREEPPGTVWSLLSRAMAKLKRELGGLPILLLLHPAERGLPAIRETVLDRARALRPLAPGTSGGPSPGPGRGGVAGPGLLAAGLAAVVVLGIVGLWARDRSGDSPSSPGRGTWSASAPRGKEAPPSHPPSPADDLPPPVDLESCDRDRELFGVVVDAAGVPVAGARVTTEFRPFGDIFYLSLDTSRMRTSGPGTRTASDGTFSLPLERGASCDLRAEAPGLGIARLGWRMAGERVRLVLAEPPSLVIIARDEDGGPVEGAIITPSRMDESGRSCTLPSAVTDAAGRCLLPEMFPGIIWLQLEHPILHGKSPFHVEAPDAGTLEVEVALVRGEMLEGVVVDADTGAGVEEARVGLGPFLQDAIPVDAGGGFHFYFDVLDTRRVLHVHAEGYARGQGAPAEDGTFRIALRRGWSAGGRLLTPEGGPVVGARVTCVGRSPPGSGYSGPDSAYSQTDEEGGFRLGMLRPGTRYTLIAEFPGRGRLLRDMAPPAEAVETVEMGDLVMVQGRAIEGILLAEDGTPLADRPVVLNGPAGVIAASNNSMDIGRRTDDRGRFRFTDRPPGAYRVVANGGTKRTPATLDFVLPEDRDATDLEVRFEAGEMLRVRTVDPAGNPVPRVLVIVLDGDRDTRAMSDEEGRALISVRRGAAVLAAVADPHVPVRWVQEPPGGIRVRAEGAEIPLLVHPSELVSGRVVDGEGGPVNGATVNLRDLGSGSSWKIITGLDGRFDLTAPRGHRFEAWATTDRLRGVVVPTKSPSEGLVLLIPSTGEGAVTVRVEDPEGKPVRGARLSAPAGVRGPRVTDGVGEARIDGVGKEGLLLGILPSSPLPEGTVAPAPVRAAAEGGTVTLRLLRGTAVEGLVQGADGFPAAGASVRIEAEGSPPVETTTDAEGRFRAWRALGARVIRAVARSADGATSHALEGDAAEGGDLRFWLRGEGGR